MDDDDAALLAAIGEGSEQAFNIFIDRHQQALRTFLRNLMANAADADDIAQEAFLAAWSKATSFAGRSSVRSWLFAIAWRKAKTHQRSWFRSRRRETAYYDATKAEENRRESPVDRLAARQALAALPMDQRAPVALCLACGLTHSETAAILDMPLGTVKSHVARGRKRLLDALETDHD